MDTLAQIAATLEEDAEQEGGILLESQRHFVEQHGQHIIPIPYYLVSFRLTSRMDVTREQVCEAASMRRKLRASLYGHLRHGTPTIHGEMVQMPDGFYGVCYVPDLVVLAGITMEFILDFYCECVEQLPFEDLRSPHFDLAGLQCIHASVPMIRTWSELD